MISRRSFLLRSSPAATLASAGLLGSRASSASGRAEPWPRPYFELITFRLFFVGQLGRLLGWAEKRALSLFRKHSFGTVGFFTVEVGPHIPSVIALLTYSSLAEMDGAWGKLHSDPEWAAGLAELEAEGPAYFRRDAMLLRATPFSPALQSTSAAKLAHKIFELRIYESSTQKQHGYMHDRFEGGEIDIFHQCGIHPILYADTVVGSNMPNLVYLTPFESEAHREKAWATFRDSPEWKKLSDQFMRRSGELARNIGNMILIPTSFSMIR